MKLSRLFTLKRNLKQHWERIYNKFGPHELGWYQDYPEMSLKLIAATGVGIEDSILDVGAGTSVLPGLLVGKGYRKVTVLDISANAIEKAKEHLGEKSDRITWIEADVIDFSFAENFDAWHDRAVFHFLTDALDREKYVNSVNQALRTGGHLIVSTFGMKAPPKCSGLKVIRYSPETLHKEFGENFGLVEVSEEVHLTPSGVQQPFIYCRFTKNE